MTQGAERVSAHAGPLVSCSRSRSRALMASAEVMAERDTYSPSAAAERRAAEVPETAPYKVNAGGRRNPSVTYATLP